MTTRDEKLNRKAIEYSLAIKDFIEGYHQAEEDIVLTKYDAGHLWKSADGDDLPEYDREVIVLQQSYPLEQGEYSVSFAHRPNPEGWSGRSLTTGNIEHLIPQTYGKGGWNVPDVVYWLDLKFPKRK